MGVASLGYLVLDVTAMDRWIDLLTSVFGMEARHRTGSDQVDMRMDDYHQRMTLRPSDRDGPAAIGWEVRSVAELEALVAKLREQQIEVTRDGGALCAERKVKTLYSFADPHIGVPTEIYYGPALANKPFSPGRGISGFKSSTTLGLGHVVFWVKDLQAAVDFYTQIMGFNISDYIAWDDNDAVFMHCNRRHHTLALMAEGPGRPAGQLQHIMLEAKSLDDVGYGYDIVRDKGIPVAIEPGKHSNDHMQSFYLKTPSDFWMEYGFGGVEIGEDWEVKTYDQPMLWGHRMVAP